jgi:hypothetical protein
VKDKISLKFFCAPSFSSFGTICDTLVNDLFIVSIRIPARNKYYSEIKVILRKINEVGMYREMTGSIGELQLYCSSSGLLTHLDLKE